MLAMCDCSVNWILKKMSTHSPSTFVFDWHSRPVARKAGRYGRSNCLFLGGGLTNDEHILLAANSELK
jgi:hypothetical protein